MKKQDKKRILKKIRRDEYLELSKVADLKEKIYTNKKKYSRKRSIKVINSKDILRQYFGEENLKLAFERYMRTIEIDSKDFSGIDIFKVNLNDNIRSSLKEF